MMIIFWQILHLADTIEENNQSQEVVALSLSSATSLFNYLIKLWTNMSEEEYKVLQQCVSPVVSSSTEQVHSTLTASVLTWSNQMKSLS